jgi:predicted site-specific integrase-resolvase
MEGAVRQVLVAHGDRLSRHVFDLLKLIIKEAGGKLVVLIENQAGPEINEFRHDPSNILKTPTRGFCEP